MPVPPPRRPAAVVGVAAGVLGLAIVAAAMGGAWSLEERHYGSFRLNRTPEPLTLPPMPSGTGESEAGGSGGGSLAVDWRIVAGALVLTAVLAIAAWLWRRWKQFAPDPPPTGAQVTGLGGVLADAEPELPPLLEAARTALDALASIEDTDDAIVAAWVAVEHGSARTGVLRHPAQTATEFTVTVLSRTHADPVAIATLRGLYLRARYSGHSTTGADVAEAQRCVRILAERWTLGAIEDPAGPVGQHR